MTFGRSSGAIISKAFRPITAFGGYPNNRATDGLSYWIFPSNPTTRIPSVAFSMNALKYLSLRAIVSSASLRSASSCSACCARRAFCRATAMCPANESTAGSSTSLNFGLPKTINNPNAPSSTYSGAIMPCSAFNMRINCVDNECSDGGSASENISLDQAIYSALPALMIRSYSLSCEMDQLYPSTVSPVIFSAYFRIVLDKVVKFRERCVRSPFNIRMVASNPNAWISPPATR